MSGIHVSVSHFWSVFFTTKLIFWQSWLFALGAMIRTSRYQVNSFSSGHLNVSITAPIAFAIEMAYFDAGLVHPVRSPSRFLTFITSCASPVSSVVLLNDPAIAGY